jgi:hypothetical protein
MAAAGLVAQLAATTGACGSGNGNGQPTARTTAPAPSESGVHAARTPKATQPPERPAVMAASKPIRIEVPAIGVDSDLMALGLQPDGTLEVPPDGFPAGWFTGAPTPGERGPAVIVGHIDWVTGPGVFYELGSLSVGDEIRVSRADGSVAVFTTTQLAEYPKDAFPTALVYGDIDHAGLRLISCGGSFNTRTGHYEDNIVAYAELLP